MSQPPATPTRPRTGWWAFVALLVVLSVLAAGIWYATRPAPGDVDSTEPGNTLFRVTPAEVATARTQLAGLAVVPRPRFDGDYSRSAFGDAWTDTDGNGCNQRDDVLLRDLVPSLPHRVGRQRGCDHDVLAGTWLDPYTGASVTLTDAKDPDQAERVQIDHIVPLSVAWRYGADGWPSRRRVAFANDLRGLVAVDGDTNQEKGGSNASEWRPRRAAWCGYAVRYLGMKDAYDLATDAAEKRALSDMLAACE